MLCVLGFDGGGTKTECVLMDDARNILARSQAGPANPLRVGFDQTLAALQDATQRAFSQTNIERSSLSALCAGLAGTGRREVAEQMHAALALAFPGLKIKVCTDLDLLLTAAGTRPAIVLAVGTGSAAIGCDSQGNTVRAGGYGPQLGDGGSAFDIGRKGIAFAISERDRSGEESSLGKQILRQLGIADWRQVQEKVASHADDVFPRVFPVVAAAADAGNKAAQDILREAARELAGLVEIVAERLQLRQSEFFLARSGGTVGRSSFFDAQLEAQLKAAAPLARLGALQMSAAEAAAHLALRLLSADAAEKQHG